MNRGLFLVWLCVLSPAPLRAQQFFISPMAEKTIVNYQLGAAAQLQFKSGWRVGGFYQQTGGNWIFKVAENGKTAYRVDIQLGRQSTDYYEVIQGLAPGDKVVTSSYENYGNMQELVLKKD